MKHTKYPFYMVVALFTLGLAKPTLAINKVDYIDVKKDGIHVNEGTVYVKPVNGQYSQATSSTVTYNTRMKAGCKGNNVIKEAFVAFGHIQVTKNALEANDNYKQHAAAMMAKSMPYQDVILKVPLNKIDNPVAMCQSMMNKKLAQGISKHQILASEHVLTQPARLTAVATCGKFGKNKNQHGSDILNTELKVICKRGSVGNISKIQAPVPGPLSPAKNVQAPLEVTKLDFRAVPAKVFGKCPAKVRFNGKITANGAGDVKYRVLFPGSEKTNLRTLKFLKAGTRTITNIEFQAKNSFPTATATLEIFSPGKKKSHAKFKVTCLAAGVSDKLKANTSTMSKPARADTTNVRAGDAKILIKKPQPDPKPPRATPSTIKRLETKPARAE